MISFDEVKQCLRNIAQLDEGDLEGKEALIENAISYAERITKGFSSSEKPRVVLLASARANYYLALLNSNENGISSFKAGDVSFTKGSSSAAESAKEFYENTLSECADLVKENDFEFRTV